MLHTFVAMVGNKSGAPTRVTAFLLFLALTPTLALAQSPPLHIKVINAKTNQPITNERLNVALKVDQIGSVAMATDKNGIILVDYGNATIIRILSNMYADCRPVPSSTPTTQSTPLLKPESPPAISAAPPIRNPTPANSLSSRFPKHTYPCTPPHQTATLPHSDENPHQPQ